MAKNLGSVYMFSMIENYPLNGSKMAFLRVFLRILKQFYHPFF